MVAFLWRQAYQVLAVKPYFIIMYEVRVFIGIHAVGREIDNTCFLVNALDVAHIELSLGDLTNQLASLAIIEVDMVTPVALTCP